MFKKLLLIIETLIISYLLYKPKPVIKQDVLVKEIVRDSLIRDSIFIENEKIKKEIVYIKEQYKQDSSNIMSVNDSILFDLFSRYIEDYHNK